MGNSSSKSGGFFSMGNLNPFPAPAPAPIPTPPPSSISYPSGTNVYSLPPNSGSLDIDLGNLQKCILQGGGSSCINNYVQGYDTSDNKFVPTQYAPQGFEQLEGNLVNNTSQNITLIIIVLLVFLIAIKY